MPVSHTPCLGPSQALGKRSYMLLSHKDKSPLTEDEGAIAYFGFPSYGYLLGECPGGHLKNKASYKHGMINSEEVDKRDCLEKHVKKHAQKVQRRATCVHNSKLILRQF
jgi:hypothetical protein